MRDLIIKVREFLVREKIYVVTFFILCIFFAILAPITFRGMDALATRYFTKQAQGIYAQLQIKTQDAYEKSRAMAADPRLLQWIKSSDTLSILSYITDQKDKYDLDNIGVTDGKGFILSRARNSSVRGDNIFFTTAHGRQLSKGNTVAVVEKGNQSPLVLSGAYPIKEAGVLEGAIFASVFVNNNFAEHFKEELGNKNDLIFYTKDKGVVSDSLKDTPVDLFLEEYLSPGSEWIQDGKPYGRIVTINPFSSYFVVNIVFPGLEQSPGGMLVLFPVLQPYLIIFVIVEIINLALYVALFFGIRKMFITSFKKHKHNTKQHLLLSSLFTIIYVAVILSLFVRQDVIRISKVPYTIYNSTLRLEPGTQIASVSEDQAIDIVVSSGGEPVNALKTILKFNPDLVSISEILTDTSICPPAMFIEKEIDNKDGVVTISCVMPSPGFSVDRGVLARLIVKHKKPGNFSLIFDPETQVLANDGLGTNVLRYSENGSYEIINPNDKNAFIIYSISNPNQEKWYNNRSVTFSVSICEKCSYAYLINNSPTETRGSYTAVASPEDLHFSVSQDGIFYMHKVKTDNSGKKPVTSTSTYRFMIDATPPESVAIKASTLTPAVGEIVRMEFSGKDSMSGLQKNFYVEIDDDTFLPLGSILFTSFPTSGKHKVTVRVYDLAGNYTDTSTDFDVR